MKSTIPGFLVTVSGLLLSGILFFSCTGSESRKDRTGTPAGEKLENPSTGDAGEARLVADRIVYDVEIINPYPDDLWTSECLESLDHESLVEFVFSGIYSGEFSAFDIFEGNPVSIRKIRKMEDNGEFSRESIGKFQFQEEWILDTGSMTFTKKVTEIRMGLQKFNEEGDLTGYAPLLRVIL
jgi:hypothetical protein